MNKKLQVKEVEEDYGDEDTFFYNNLFSRATFTHKHKSP